MRAKNLIKIMTTLVCVFLFVGVVLSSSALAKEEGKNKKHLPIPFNCNPRKVLAAILLIPKG